LSADESERRIDARSGPAAARHVAHFMAIQDSTDGNNRNVLQEHDTENPKQCNDMMIETKDGKVNYEIIISHRNKTF